MKRIRTTNEVFDIFAMCLAERTTSRIVIDVEEPVKKDGRDWLYYLIDFANDNGTPFVGDMVCFISNSLGGANEFNSYVDALNFVCDIISKPYHDIYIDSF